MLFSIYKETVKTDRIEKSENSLAFFRNGKPSPFAHRSDSIDTPTVPEKDSVELSEIGVFSVYQNSGSFLCRYCGGKGVTALISPLQNQPLDTKTVKALEEYLLKAYRLDPCTISLHAAFEEFEELVTIAASFCGCLTDILKDGFATRECMQYSPILNNSNCENIAFTLPIIALMYRRISAMRGFNFKVTLKDSLPCLIFSAKVILDNGKADHDVSEIIEYSELLDLFGADELIIGARLKETDDEDAPHRLSVAICPQTVDPRGILRAPVWKKHAKAIIDGLELELDGKY